MDTYSTYNLYAKSLDKTLARTAKEPQVAREVAYYQSKISSVKTVDDFMKDSRLVTFALKAWGLGDMANSKGLIRKALESGIDTSTSLGNTLMSGKFREFVSVFNFKAYGASTTVFDKVQTTTVDNYIRNQLETEVGQQSGAVQLALYFQRKAPKITSALSILADKNLLKVVQTALNIPASMSNSPLDAQISLIDSKMKVADLKDPAKLNKFLQRYAANYDAQNGTGSSTPNALLSAGSSQVGFGTDILMSLQRIR